jgi:methanogenic corrinoid protein MtbC1
VGQNRAEELGDRVREASPAVSVAVTAEFLERHPDWRERYGARATTEGVRDAGFHLAFLAGAIEGGDTRSFAAYARWAAGVLSARGIATRFLAENLAQLRDALAARLAPGEVEAIAPYFREAIDALASESGAAAGATLQLTADVYLQAILSGQRHAAVQIAKEALREGLTLQDLYLDVFQPAMYEVGACWEANRISVAQEHIATAITQFVMAQVYEPPVDRPGDSGTVVLTGVEGELHSIGAVMVGDLLESSGWRVHFLGTNLPASSILSVIRETAPSHVGISATMLFNVPAVRQLVAAIRAEFAERIRILVGGAAFRTTPDLWRQVAADAFAPDLRAVQSLFHGHA